MFAPIPVCPHLSLSGRRLSVGETGVPGTDREVYPCLQEQRVRAESATVLLLRQKFLSSAFSASFRSGFGLAVETLKWLFLIPPVVVDSAAPFSLLSAGSRLASGGLAWTRHLVSRGVRERARAREREGGTERTV